MVKRKIGHSLERGYIIQDCQIQISKTRGSSQKKSGVEQEIFSEKSGEKPEDFYQNYEAIWHSYFEENWNLCTEK